MYAPVENNFRKLDKILQKSFWEATHRQQDSKELPGPSGKYNKTQRFMPAKEAILPWRYMTFLRMGPKSKPRTEQTWEAESDSFLVSQTLKKWQSLGRISVRCWIILIKPEAAMAFLFGKLFVKLAQNSFQAESSSRQK